MQVKSYYKTNAEEICQPTEARSTKEKKCPQKRIPQMGRIQQSSESGLVSADWLPTASLLCGLVPCFQEAFFLQ